MNNDEKFGCLKIDEIQVDLDEMSDEELARIEEQIVKAKTEIRKIIDETLEIVEISTTNNNDNCNNEPIEENIKKVLEKQYQHSIIKAVRNVKRSRDLINANEMQLEKFINEQSKKFGQPANVLDKDVEEYKNMLEQINTELNKIKKSLMKQKEDIQNTEYDKILMLSKKRDERKVLKKSDEYKEYRTQINNLNRDLIKEMETESPNDAEIKRINAEIETMEKQDKLMICENEIQELRKDIIEARKLSIEIDKQIDQCTANLKDYIEYASKDGELIVLGNANVKIGAIQKIFASIFNKIGGANKFNEAVVKVVKQKVDRMKTIYIPEVIKKVHDDGIDGVSAIIEKNQKLQKLPDEMGDVKLTAKQEITSIIDKFKIIIDNGNDKRKTIIKMEV